MTTDQFCVCTPADPEYRVPRRRPLGKLCACVWTCLQAEVRRLLGRDDVVPGTCLSADRWWPPFRRSANSCTGNVILDVYDLARELRNAAVTVIGGFHSPMERECLELLLRGTQPIIICPARSLQTMRIAKAWNEALESGRLLLSPFPPSQRTVTADSATRRNRFVAQIADEILVAHAAAGGKTEAFCRELLGTRKPGRSMAC